MNKHLISFLAAALFLTADLFAGKPQPGVMETTVPAFCFRGVVEASAPGAEEVKYMVRNKEETIYLGPNVLLDQSVLKGAKLNFEPNQLPGITLNFTDEGKARLLEVTMKYVSQRIAILLNGKVNSAPVVREPIAGGTLEISGSFSLGEARELVRKINEAVPHAKP